MHMYMQIFKDYWQKSLQSLYAACFILEQCLKMAVLLITVNKQNDHDMFTAFTVNEFTELVFTVNPLICLQYLQLIH